MILSQAMEKVENLRKDIDKLGLGLSQIEKSFGADHVSIEFLRQELEKRKEELAALMKYDVAPHHVVTRG